MQPFNGKKVCSVIALVFAVFLLSGCATIIRGTEETVVFKTEPSGVRVALSNGQSCITPCELKIDRGLYLDASFEKEGYETKVERLNSKFSSGYVFVSMLGTVIGVLVDGYSNSWMSFEQNPMELNLARTPTANMDQDYFLTREPLEVVPEDSELTKYVPKGVSAGKHDIAVIIGNRDYQASGVPAVDFALNDSRTMKKYIEETLGYQGENILYLENASYAAMNQTFGSERDHRGKLFNFVTPGESRVFIYYVGHGAPDLDTGEAYFVPVDSDPQYLQNSGYRLRTFYDNIAKLQAKDVTIVLDACFSGGSQRGLLFKGISPAMVKVQKETAGPKNAVVFTSGRNDQVSTWFSEKGHSLFTYYFLKGLQGEANQDGNKKLSVAEMDAYLGANVPYMARRLSGREQVPSVSGSKSHVMAVLQ